MSFTSKLLTIPLVAALAVLAVLTSTATAQTLTNPGFELGTQGWSNWGRFTTTSDAYSGNQAARASGTGGFGSSTLTGVTPGATYTLSGYAKTSGSPSFAGIAFNAGIPGVAQRQTTANSDVVVVDHFTGFDDSLIRSDGIHPNDAGQQVMAQRWIDAMNAYYQ